MLGSTIWGSSLIPRVQVLVFRMLSRIGEALPCQALLAQFAAAENDFWEKKLSEVHRRTEPDDGEEEEDDDDVVGGSGDADAADAMLNR